MRLVLCILRYREILEFMLPKVAAKTIFITRPISDFKLLLSCVASSEGDCMALFCYLGMTWFADFDGLQLDNISTST